MHIPVIRNLQRRVIRLVLPMLLPWLVLATFNAHAQTVYRCVIGHERVAFQSEPCSTRARQTQLNVQPLPLVQSVVATPIASYDEHPSRRRGDSRRAKLKQEMSYECRAGNGEVFYRHARCPRSIAGDGIARFGANQYRKSASRGRRRMNNAWSAVSVTSRKIPRIEACKQINAVIAGGRDGNANDEQVSVYDHDIGRDPCRGY